MNYLTDLSEFKLPPLVAGAHTSPDEGLCALEMVAFIEREEHTDHPLCVCPVIAAFVQVTNDWFNDDERALLLPKLSALVGTVSQEHEIERAKYLAQIALAFSISIDESDADAARSAAKAAEWAEDAAEWAESAVNSGKAAINSAASAASAAEWAYKAALTGSIRARLVTQSLAAIDAVVKIGSPVVGFSNPDEQIKKLELMEIKL